jgi:hypothetical protein
MKLLRLTQPLVFPDGCMDVGSRHELIEIVDGQAIVLWRGKRRRINPALLEDAGEAEKPRRARFA